MVVRMSSTATPTAGSMPIGTPFTNTCAVMARQAKIPIPKPAVQRSLILPDGGPALRPDFTWVQQRVILEADGDRVHATRQARERRNLRDQRLIVHGWRPLHATARQLTQGSVELEATLIALVNGRR